MNDLNICKNNAFGQFADDLQTQNSNNNILNDSNSDKFIKKVNCPDDVISILNDIKIKNVNKLIIGNLNINSFARKFDQFKTIIQNKLDIVVITETKLDNSYPPSQFSIDGFSKPYRLDRNKHGGGILIYIREDIPSKQLSKHNFTKDIEGIFVEINLRKTKWLLFGSYHPPKNSDQDYFEQVGLALDTYNDYDKFLLVGDFNAEDSEPCLKNFLYQYDAKNIVKQKTCFKSTDNPSCIDLFLTNSYRSFQNTCTVSTGLSDFHKMTITVLKSTFQKSKPKKIIYRDYRKFEENNFKTELKIKLKNKNIKDYETFENIFLTVLNKYAPCKKKVVRANNKPYMTKTLRKAIMRRSALESKYYKHSTPENNKAYRKQKNFCSKLYKKERRKYYSSLDIKKNTDNKKFWETIKPFFSDKGPNNQNITLVNNDSIISDDQDVAETFNTFFKNAVDSLHISENRFLLAPTESLTDPVEIAIKKFESHPSIFDIKDNINNSNSFFRKLMYLILNLN